MGELRLSIPNHIHKQLKQIALDKEISLKKLITDILESFTKDDKPAEVNNE